MGAADRVQNFFWVPAAEYLGKRPVFVLASLIFFCAVVGSAVSTDYNTLLACRVLSTVGGSSTEALGAAIINVGGQYGLWSIAIADICFEGHILPPRTRLQDGNLHNIPVRWKFGHVADCWICD